VKQIPLWQKKPHLSFAILLQDGFFLQLVLGASVLLHVAGNLSLTACLCILERK
jgi:hypothetical protein